MQEEANDSKTFDVQYSIRLPEDLATEINARAAAEGVKPSTWIRNCITSAIKQKDELTADKLRSPLLMLLKRDKSVRAIIKDISSDNEKLSEETKLRKRCEDLTTSMSGIMERMDETKRVLNRLRKEYDDADRRAMQLTSEIGVLKQISHGSDSNPATKEMIKRHLEKLNNLNAERRRIADSIPSLEMSLREDESLIEEMKRDSQITMKQLNMLAEQAAVSRNRDEL